MPDVVISFLDGEILYARTPEITFELPLIEAEVNSADPNSERALFPTSAIRQMIVGAVERAPDPGTLSRWDRAVFHFLDGQVLRANISPEVMLGRHGGIWHTVEPDSAELRSLAVPYTALKGIFRVRQWDSRPVKERGLRPVESSSQLDDLARVLAERENRPGPLELPTHRRTLLKRMRGR